MEDQADILFCFPYKIVGGVSLLFLRVSEYLAAQNNEKISVVDYDDGFISLNHNKELVSLISYSDEHKVNLPEQCVVVFQSMTPWSIFPGLQLSPRTRVLFWTCHPFNLVPTLPGLRGPMQRSSVQSKILLSSLLHFYKRKMCRFVDLLVSKDSLVFMDKTTLDSTVSSLGVKIDNPVYVPITTVDAKRTKVTPTVQLNEKSLRFGWIGRIADFKYHILLYTLKELERIGVASNQKIDFVIVGEGEYFGVLQKEVKQFSALDISFVSYVPPGEMDDFICEYIDVQFAMGTSALESAKLGVPTILLDVSYGKVSPGYVFRWLYDVQGYSLGELIDGEMLQAPNSSLSEILEEVQHNYDDVSLRTKRYFEQIHSIEVVASKLFTALGRARCNYGDLKTAGLLGRGLFYNVFTLIRKRVFRK